MPIYFFSLPPPLPSTSTALQASSPVSHAAMASRGPSQAMEVSAIPSTCHLAGTGMQNTTALDDLRWDGDRYAPPTTPFL